MIIIFFGQDYSVPLGAKDRAEFVIALQPLGGIRMNGWNIGVTRGNVIVVRITMSA